MNMPEYRQKNYSGREAKARRIMFSRNTPSAPRRLRGINRIMERIAMASSAHKFDSNALI